MPPTDPARPGEGGELLPCPFCGGPGKLDDGRPHDPNDWTVGCRSCDYSLEFRSSPQAAVEAWNTRSGAGCGGEASAEPSHPKSPDIEALALRLEAAEAERDKLRGALEEGERRLTQCLGIIVEFGNLNGFRNLSDQELGGTVVAMAEAASDTLYVMRAALSSQEGEG